MGFRRLVEIITNKKPVDAQNPLQIDGDSVYSKDVDSARSVMNNFSGHPTDFFDDLHSSNIDSTATAIKEVIIKFKRTVVTPLIGIGSNDGGDFSNVKVIAILSGGTEVTLFDDSVSVTKHTSKFFQFPNAGLNELKLQFHTTDTVSITNIFIPKIHTVSSVIETTTKFASSYGNPYLLNAASQDMNINGSVTPVDFEYEHLGLSPFRWNRSFIDLQDGAQDFSPTNFGAINNGLTTGCDIIVEKAGVETIVENWKTNMDISMTMFDFSSPYKLGAYVGRWTIKNDMGNPITLFSGDKVILRVNDDLTGLDSFRTRIKGSK